MLNESISKKIKILRKTRGLTQQQLADRLGVQRATISNYEVGRRTPQLKDIKALSTALGVTLEYFAIEDNSIINLVSRAKVLFENDDISNNDKATIYKEIMKLYLQLEESV